MRLASTSDVAGERTPTTGIVRCCARAASGHVMAEPATTLMKSRRRITAPKVRSTPILADYIRDLRPAKWGSMINLRCKHLGSPMSALGQKQTSRHLQPMSALHPKADIGTQLRNVRFVPKADSCTAAILSLFDHLVDEPRQPYRSVIRIFARDRSAADRRA